MFDFKGFVDAMFRRQRDEGVHDLKSATVWMQQLPQSDIHQAQVEIVKALISLNNNTKISTKERFRTVLYLDEKAQKLQQYLIDVFFGKKGLGQDHSRVVLPAILSFWHEMANAYRHCIKHYSESPSRSLAPSMEIATVRAIYLFAMQAKWSYLRYLELDVRVWRNLNRLYSFAESQGFADKPVRLYPDSTQETTAANEYLQAMMLHLSMPEKREQRQIMMIDRWLDHWSAMLQLETLIRPHRQDFAVNLDEARPPLKLRRNMMGDRYRYWETEKLIQHIQAIMEEIRQGNMEQLRLGEEFRLPAGMMLLEDLIRVWSRENGSPSRKHERTHTQKAVQVVQGLQDVVQLVKNPAALVARKHTGNTSHSRVDVQTLGPYTQSKMTREPEIFKSEQEEWIVENESMTGFGANYHAAGQDHLHIGELIGLKANESNQVAIGIVRRLNRNKENKVSVGIETICQTPVLVELTDDDGSNPFQTIYSPENQQAGTGRFLLLPTAKHQESQAFRLSAQGKTYRIRLTPALEHMSNYVISNFNVTAKL